MPAQYGCATVMCRSCKHPLTSHFLNSAVCNKYVVVWPEVAYLRVVGSFPTQWTGLSTEPVSVGSRLHNSLQSAQGLVDTIGRWKHGLAYST
jgi:hypothetical protein